MTAPSVLTGFRSLRYRCKDSGEKFPDLIADLSRVGSIVHDIIG